MIRSAKVEDSKVLTEISFASKGHWNYPKEYFQIWKKELTISPDYVLRNEIFVYESDGAIIGYYSVANLKEDITIGGAFLSKGIWLEHMFIDPPNIGNGIGTKLFAHLRERCLIKGVRKLGILADPNSRGFYEKMGCIYMGEYPSTIKGRTTPFLELRIVDR
jgi:GNAT superfamily N-acetyltransferase